MERALPRSDNLLTNPAFAELGTSARAGLDMTMSPTTAPAVEEAVMVDSEAAALPTTPVIHATPTTADLAMLAFHIVPAAPKPKEWGQMETEVLDIDLSPRVTQRMVAELKASRIALARSRAGACSSQRPHPQGPACQGTSRCLHREPGPPPA